jgi:hypothetical protein
VDGDSIPQAFRLLGDTVNEKGTHIRLFVKKISLTVWPEKSINSI